MSAPILYDRQGRSYRKFQARNPWPGDEDRSGLWVKPATKHSWKMLVLAAGLIVGSAVALARLLGHL